MEKVVASQAAAASQRADGVQCNSLMRSEEKAHLVNDLTEGMSQSKAALWKGASALNEFLEFAQRNAGNAVRFWFKLDPEEKMQLSYMVFTRRLLDLGFRGNIAAMWQYVNSDRDGHVRLWELDPRAAVTLAGFKYFMETKCEGSSEQAFRSLDHNRSGRIYKDQFVTQLRSLGYEGPASRVFDQLDRRGFGYVPLRDMDFLVKWQPRPYLCCKSDPATLKRVKDALLQLHGKPLFKVWRKVLDPELGLRVTWKSFLEACKRVAIELPGLPKTAKDIAPVWRALDKDCSGWISLGEFDPEGSKAIAEFKKWAEEVHGSAVDALYEIDRASNGNGRLSETEFSEIQRGPFGYKGDFNLLFNSLDHNDSGRISEDDVKFIDNWDLAWEEWETVLRRCERPISGRRRDQPNN